MNMYKENAKAGKSAIGPAILWIVFMYVFYILWGVGEILLGFHPPVLIKHLVLWALTGWFGWTIISKFLTEYEFAARKNEFTVTKKLSNKVQVICTVKYENIEAIYNNKQKSELKNYTKLKKYNFVSAFQTGAPTHIVYRFDGRLNLITLKISRNMLKVINENIEKKKEEII